MLQQADSKTRETLLMIFFIGLTNIAFTQVKINTNIKKASQKIETGFEKNNQDTLAQGYFDLGESYFQKGESVKSETYYQKAKNLYEKMDDPEGIAKSSRALANVQEELRKNKEALTNYSTAQGNNFRNGDFNSTQLNTNDINRLLKPDSIKVQKKFLLANIGLGIQNKDTNEIISNYSKMADINLQNNSTSEALSAYRNAYYFSVNKPEQALRYNQRIADVYLKDKNFIKAIETKKEALNEPFVQNSTQIKASEISLLADIYIQKKESSIAIKLLNESYTLSIQNGHTLEAKKCIEKLDSIFQSVGKIEKSLTLYRDFLTKLPGILDKDSSFTDNKIMVETEEKLKKLEKAQALKDLLIKRKNIFNYWLVALIVILLVFTAIILYFLKKLKIKNKKIALQSLRREMNPHFIFNSLNSINQFIANNNELEANQYLAKFSTLMRRVMENSKEDFVLFSKEIELLQNYLDLEKSRFPDKFDFSIHIDNLLVDEQLYIPGMLIQPHLENAIWHGLRYIDKKGFLQLRFIKNQNNIDIIIEDNGIGIAESKKSKTNNQKKYSGRGIANTLERINIFNELYHQHIICNVKDKTPPENGVIVQIIIPILKNHQS